MEENTHIEENQQPTQGNAPEQNTTEKVNWLARILGGDVLSSKVVVKQLPLILLLTLYGLLLVSNRYRVEQLTKDKIDTQEHINYLRERRIDLQKRFQETIKISQIAEMLSDSDVGITAGPPYEI